MAISIVGTIQSGSNFSGGNVTLTFDGSPAEDDVVYLFGGHGSQGTANIGPSESGYTTLVSHTASGPFFGVWRKVLGASPDSGVTGLNNGDGDNAASYIAIVLRGVDTSSPEDATTTEAGPTSDFNPDPPSITTVTDDAWVIPAAGSTEDEITFGPSGYSNFTAAGETDTRRHATGIATTEKATAGAEDPGTFTHPSSTAWYTATVAVRPAGSSQQDLTGSTFQKSPTFPTGTVSTTYDLTGSTFQQSPTFPTGEVSQVTSLTGTTFQKAPSFPTGTVEPGEVTVSGSTFQKAPSFPQGSVDPGSVTVTGTTFQKSPTFPTGTVSATYDLTGSVFQQAPTFPTGTVTPGSVTLTGSVFQKAPTFPTGDVSQGQTLTGTVFQQSPTFPTGTVTPGSVTLSGTVFQQAPTFPTGLISPPVSHVSGVTSVALDASSTDAGIAASLVDVSLDASRTFMSLDASTTDAGVDPSVTGVTLDKSRTTVSRDASDTDT